ncbi:27 kDa hemolymph protein-like isoform X1 [Neodiprion pinetum]|uniref:27 kDa hemolymph protein isoform X1 n=2 Tax=Neodiprion lecontei TaxID=441921 RepID=A0A6J0C5P1_NEOLC|nr:27 kDa hemolymph protein isoform X1 [Neodiprion lecontei]XP_046479579.1 27 kDa hemolymph protein-like isoform X1 [Neodiprion pinetum]
MRNFTTLICVLVAGLLSFSIAQEQTIPSKEEIMKKVPVLNSIQGLANFNASDVNTEKAEELIKNKCNKNGGPEAYDTAKGATQNLMECVTPLINFTQLEAEMAEATPKGDLDVVFKKYCGKIPDLKACVTQASNLTKPCLEAEERQSINMFHNVTDALLGFICDNEGDRIAMFLAAGGRECFNNSRQAIEKCANDTLKTHLSIANLNQTGLSPLDSIPLLILDADKCRDIEKFQNCTVRVLEECKDPTPANVFDSLVNFAMRSTPCNPAPVSNSLNGASSSLVNVLSLTLAMAMFSKYV